MCPIEYSGVWKYLYDWQTIIASLFALFAAYVGAKAAFCVGNSQMAAAKKRDRLMARCLAVGIAPELQQLKADFERAVKIIDEEFPRAKAENWATFGTVSLIGRAKIEIPALINRIVEQLFLLGPAGATLIQLISVTLQYDRMIDALAQQISLNIDSFNPSSHREHLSRHLNVIAKDIAEAERLIEPLHDEATS